jgi:hypothetical protein
MWDFVNFMVRRGQRRQSARAHVAVPPWRRAAGQIPVMFASIIIAAFKNDNLIGAR